MNRAAACRKIAAALAVLALLICIAAPVRLFLGEPTGDYDNDFEIFRSWFNAASLLWFLSAPFWLIPDLLGKGKGD